MLSLILTLAMVPTAPVAQSAQVTTCQWPNKCVSTPVAQVTTCQWPNKCLQTAPVLPLTAQVTTCQYPHTCAKAKA